MTSPDVLTRKITNRLARRLEEAGYSIPQAAHEADVPLETLQRNLACEASIEVRDLLRLSDLLGTKVSDLVASEEDQ